ncbi:hypothetical protein [Flavobacterium sp. WC2430]|uniref:hypothetical protein n=1 Tax=Flavobacterium sp. WC2430 TaxID=3234137 RepID=UPI003466AE87
MNNLDANNTSAYHLLDTTNMFDTLFSEANEPPIDTYISKITNLILLVDPNPLVFNKGLANLLVLGSVSAFESYMREVLRRTILIDRISLKNCESLPLSYGAAISHGNDLMPEAILEDVSFAGKFNIQESLKKFLNLKGNLPDSLIATLDEFVKVCELRHCLVHRFGKLGTKNAIKLGLSDHSNCIEKPLQLDYIALQNLQVTCNALVKEINNYIFNSLLKRLIIDDRGKKINNVIWTWKYNQDRMLFLKYYKTFVSSIEVPRNHSTAKQAYDLYRNSYNNLKR